MAVLQNISPARTSADHLRPLDSILILLEDCECTWCRGLLTLLLNHLESDIPVFGLEARQ